MVIQKSCLGWFGLKMNSEWVVINTQERAVKGANFLLKEA